MSRIHGYYHGEYVGRVPSGTSWYLPGRVCPEGRIGIVKKGLSRNYVNALYKIYYMIHANIKMKFVFMDPNKVKLILSSVLCISARRKAREYVVHLSW